MTEHVMRVHEMGNCVKSFVVRPSGGTTVHEALDFRNEVGRGILGTSSIKMRRGYGCYHAWKVTAHHSPFRFG